MCAQFGRKFGKRRFTGSAAPALDAALAVVAEALRLVLAKSAGAGLSPLALQGESPKIIVGCGSPRDSD